MKKLMSVMLGLSLLVPVMSFAQDKPAPKTEKGKKKKGKKGGEKGKKGSGTTTPPPK